MGAPHACGAGVHTDRRCSHAAKIRDKISGLFATVFLGAIAVVFIFWGIQFESSATASAAKVNGERIPLEVIRKAWQDRRRSSSRRCATSCPRNSSSPSSSACSTITSVASSCCSRPQARLSRERPQAGGNGLRIRSTAGRRQVLARSLRGAAAAAGPHRDAVREPAAATSCRSASCSNGIAVSAFVTPGELARREALEGETRDIEYATVPRPTSCAGVVTRRAGRRRWYGEHKTRIHDAGVRSTCSTCSSELADIAAGVQVTDEALHKYYDEIAAERYAVAEQRRARHILIETGSDARCIKASAPKGCWRACRPERISQSSPARTRRIRARRARAGSSAGRDARLTSGRSPMRCSHCSPDR